MATTKVRIDTPTKLTTKHNLLGRIWHFDPEESKCFSCGDKKFIRIYDCNLQYLDINVLNLSLVGE